MKKFLIVIVVAGLGGAVGAIIVFQRLQTRHSAELATYQAQWQAEKAELEAELENARTAARMAAAPAAAPIAAVPVRETVTNATPGEIIAKLLAGKSGATPARIVRLAVHDLEDLIALGPSAVPAIRGFLAEKKDIVYQAPDPGKGGRGGSILNEFIYPPSLRFGLFDALRRIGGTEAEVALGEALSSSDRGVEVAWLARTLQEMAPNKYREVALAAAKGLLARPVAINPANPLDNGDRDNLFSVLAMFGDTTYVSTAQTQLVRSDGAVDRPALKYIQQSLGQQSIGIAAQLYDDPRLSDPSKKEPLARLALNFVGADAQANEFFQKAINDLALPQDHRRNLIEDLNQDGFMDRKNLREIDLQLIQNRIALIEQMAPNATDPVNAKAFGEAYKDLLKMRDRILNPKPSAVK